MGSNISLIPANICCFNSSCSGLSSLTFTSVDSVGDFCELALSSRLHLLFLAEEVLGFNCSFMLVCHIAPVVFKLFALVLVFDVVLSVNFLSPDDSLSTSYLLLLRFNLLSKLRLLSCDIPRIMLSYLLDCFVLSSNCFNLFPHNTFPQVKTDVASLYYHSFKFKFIYYVQLVPLEFGFLHSTLLILLLVLSSYPLNPVHLSFNGF